MKLIFNILKSVVIAGIVLAYGCTDQKEQMNQIKRQMSEKYHLYMDQHVAFISVSLEKALLPLENSTDTKQILSSDLIKKIISNKSFKIIPSAIFQYELASLGNELVSIKQYNKIREHTIQLMKDSLNNQIRYMNRNVVNTMVDTIINSFSDLFPLKYAYSYYKEQKDYAGTFLLFMESENENYCNDKNLIPGDCNWGYIFLAANGNSLFKFECVGSDTIQYNIGTFEDRADTLVCSFKKSYTYPEKYDPNTDVSISNPNEGDISSSGSFILKLQPCECMQYPFVIKYSNEEEPGISRLQTYVVKVASFKEQDDFIKSIKAIKVVSQMIKINQKN